MTDTSNRIEALELRVAHQDKAIADLNDVILAQWKKIEMLERSLSRLNEEMQSMDSSSVPVDRPPHY